MSSLFVRPGRRFVLDGGVGVGVLGGIDRAGTRRGQRRGGQQCSKKEQGTQRNTHVRPVDEKKVAAQPRPGQGAGLKGSGLLRAQIHAITRVGVGVDGRVVEQYGKVQIGNLGHHPVVLPLLDANAAQRQGQQGHRQAETQQPIAARRIAVAAPARGGHLQCRHPQGCGRPGRGARQGRLAGFLQAQVDRIVDVLRAFVEGLADPVGEFCFVHSSIPRARRALASACVAREQCVFTLPSEHFIDAAVSETSRSSQ